MHLIEKVALESWRGCLALCEWRAVALGFVIGCAEAAEVVQRCLLGLRKWFVMVVAPSPGGSLPCRLFSFRFAPSENALA